MEKNDGVGTMKIAVCEDNATQLDAICGYIKSYCKRNCYINDIHRFTSAEAFLEVFSPGKFPLVFLDIYLNGMSGIDAARKIREIDPNCTLVFITSSSEHALEAFSVKATTYINKPLKKESVEEALDMCGKVLNKNARIIRVPAGYGETLVIPLTAIRYVEVSGKKAQFYIGRETISARMPLDKIEEMLDGDPFLRCHRSFIVNMNYVDAVRDDSFLMKNGSLVPIGRNNRVQIRLAMTQFMTRRSLEE